MNRFSPIDPTILPPLTLVQVPDKEIILRARLNKVKELWSSYDPPLGAQYDVDNLEFDPIRITMEAGTAFEINALSFVNQMGKATTLAMGWGANLDQIASRYPGGVPRLPGETDDRYRYRLWLSSNAYSTAGPSLAYVFEAMTAVPEMKDVTAVVDRVSLRDEPIVTVTCLIDDPDLLAAGAAALAAPSDKKLADAWIVAIGNYDPTPSDDQLLMVQAQLTDRSNVPLTDVKAVRAPEIINTDIAVRLIMFPNTDQDVAIQAVKLALGNLVEAHRYLGADMNRMSIFGVCNDTYGVQNVIIDEPVADIAAGDKQYVLVGDITVTVAGVAS